MKVKASMWTLVVLLSLTWTTRADEVVQETFIQVSGDEVIDTTYLLDLNISNVDTPKYAGYPVLFTLYGEAYAIAPTRVYTFIPRGFPVDGPSDGLTTYLDSVAVHLEEDLRPQTCILPEDVITNNPVVYGPPVGGAVVCLKPVVNDRTVHTVYPPVSTDEIIDHTIRIPDPAGIHPPRPVSTPEPGTFSSLVMGIGALGWLGFRKRRLVFN